MKRLLTLVPLLAALSSPLSLADNVAKREIDFNDGDTIPVTLSSLNINRLMVKDDKIVNITCPSGFCTTTRQSKG